MKKKEKNKTITPGIEIEREKINKLKKSKPPNMEVEKKVENSKLQSVIVLLYLCEECGECCYTKTNYENHFRNIHKREFLYGGS